MPTDLSKLRHDLCTPLNQVLGYSEMLLEDVKGLPELEPAIQEIFNGGKRLHALISKVITNDGPGLESIRSQLQEPFQALAAQAQQVLADAKKSGSDNFLVDLQKIATAAGDLPEMLKTFQAGSLKTTSFETAFQFLTTPAAAAKLLDIGPGRILVVDDAEMNRDVLSRRLERQGHHVTRAENGQQALDALAQSSFDLVLLDIIMPEMDGYQVLKTLKADPRLRHLPVIMLSAIDEIESVVRCIELGADDYLPKPFNPVLLQARIGACLEKKHLRDQEQNYLKQLQAEQEKSDRLLLNVLPREIAQRLKQGETAIADHFPEVTILFADLVGFTSLSQHISPVEVVNLLNEIFSEFDVLATRHGVEKIKTIGDAYMVAGGLPVFRPDHAHSIAEMALDIQKVVKRFNEDYKTQVQVRIGINTGPVVAGIIGRNKFIYDLWGDTVNTASRMESTSVPGGIQVTEETRTRLESDFTFQSREEFEVKGKGRMRTYLLTGKKG
jgi:class 3 adenylate cyclase